MNRISCRGCIHHRRLWDHGTPVPKICHYLLDTGKIRPCPASSCTCKELGVRSGMKREFIFGARRGAGPGAAQGGNSWAVRSFAEWGNSHERG